MKRLLVTALVLAGLLGPALPASAAWYNQPIRSSTTCASSLLAPYADVPRGARTATVQLQHGQLVVLGIPSRHRYLVAMQPGRYKFTLERGDWRLLLGPPSGGSLRFSPCHPTG